MQSLPENYADEGEEPVMLVDDQTFGENDEFFNLARAKNLPQKRRTGTIRILKRAGLGYGLIRVLKKRSNIPFGRIRLL